ncbi:MAG: DUF3859 domain-containing protein [Vannielia sp.]|uniref:DUF3859 domain-containing protein n=1 Tax=Rhodobacterales TaxID=204455 RepID=UPI0020941F08|nr:DUF3859 domain-containing protein [Oceanicola sp. 502str15]MCO6384991.1 DUF3859 domain-containing protein [Oceanicola sp. 502str15]
MIRAALLMSTALALPAAAQEASADLYINPALVADVSYGLNCSVEITGSIDAPDTDRGEVDVFDKSPELSPLGQLVPAQLGLGFGVRARAADGVRITGATFRVFHPPFPGRGTTEQSWLASYVDSSHSTHLYRFDFPYEAVPGTWVMEATHEGELLYRIPFTVVPEAAYPGAETLCDPEGLLSLAPSLRHPA